MEADERCRLSWPEREVGLETGVSRERAWDQLRGGREMECPIYEQLEKELIKARDQRTRLSMTGSLTDTMAQRLAEAEEEAILRLTDHRSEHRCKRPGE